ncbi:hypothetical protein D3C73_600210 [compost metagenome]
MTGARLKLIPKAFNSLAVIRPAAYAFSGRPDEAIAIAPATFVASLGIRVTRPPSWSIVIKPGIPVCVVNHSCNSVTSSPS